MWVGIVVDKNLFCRLSQKLGNTMNKSEFVVFWCGYDANFNNSDRFLSDSDAFSSDSDGFRLKLQQLLIILLSCCIHNSDWHEKETSQKLNKLHCSSSFSPPQSFSEKATLKLQILKALKPTTQNARVDSLPCSA